MCEAHNPSSWLEIIAFKYVRLSSTHFSNLGETLRSEVSEDIGDGSLKMWVLYLFFIP